jgi:pimeloyl-ACP methyl ester carboxylesterase
LQLLPQIHDPAIVTKALPQIRCPALVLWGEEDPLVPLELGRRLVADLPAGRLITVPHCGHLPHEDRPDETAELLRAWLEAAGPPAGAA